MDAKLIVVGGQATKSEVPLVNFPVLIGRNRTAALPIAHPLVSRNHCEIFHIRGALVVRDLESANGTRINDELIEEEVLKPGDRLTVGPLTFVAIYKFAGEVPDLESLRASEEENGPFFEEAVADDPVSLSAEDIIEADILEDEKPAEKPKPAAGKGKEAAAKGKGKGAKSVSDKEATLEFNSKKQDDDEDLMDLKLEDLLLDSTVDAGKREPEPTPRERTREPNPGESGLVSPYSNSGVQVRAEEGVIARNELSLRPPAAPGKPPAKTPAAAEKPAAEKPKPAAAAAKASPEKPKAPPEKPKAPPAPKSPATVQMASSIDDSVDMALTIEDSEDFLLDDSGVSSRATLTNRSIDESLDAAIVEASSDSFDAVKLLTGASKPPDRNPRGAPREDDGKQVISFVLPSKEWGNSGVQADQLRESKQPTDFLLRLQLPDAGKIRVGTPVRVAGIDVGMVTDLNWVATGGHLRAEALLNIQKRLGEVLRDDCRIGVQESGDAVAIIIESPGVNDKHLEHGQVMMPAK
jgi:hypothetical protein